MKSDFENRLQKALGDWQGEFNAWKERCPKCDGYHEEPGLVLSALTGWPCDRVAKYHSEVFNRCLDGDTPFQVKYRRFRRLAPHWRIGGHTGQESDADYCERMRALKENRVDFDLLLHTQAGGSHAQKRPSRTAPGGPVRTRYKGQRKAPNSPPQKRHGVRR